MSGGLPHKCPEVATFNCEAGYSTDGEHRTKANMFFTAACLNTGLFEEKPAGCKPVLCGDVVVPSNSKQVSCKGQKDMPFELKYLEEACWQCEPGYSVDGRLLGITDFRTECLADGKICAQWLQEYRRLRAARVRCQR